MYHPLPRILLATGLSAAGGFAQEGVSRPAGYLVQTIPAGLSVSDKTVPFPQPGT